MCNSCIGSLPFELQTAVNESYPWRMGTFFCRFRIFLTELCPLVSILILTIFSAERYLSICHPFRKVLRFSQFDAGHSYNRTSYMRNVSNNTYLSSEKIPKTPNSKGKRSTYGHGPSDRSHYKRSYTSYAVQINALKSCFILILCVWILAGCCATVIAGLSKVFYAVSLPTVDEFINTTCSCQKCNPNILSDQAINCLEDDELWAPGEALTDSSVCAPSNDSEWAAYMSIPVVLQLWTFLFFFTPMIIIFGNNQASRSNLGIQSSGNGRRGIVRMLVAIVVAFFICWAPFHLQRILTSANVQMTWFFIDFLFYMSGFLYYMSATVNPILYSLMSARFRRAFLSTFRIKRSRSETASCTHPIVSMRIVRINNNTQISSQIDNEQQTPIENTSFLQQSNHEFSHQNIVDKMDEIRK
ncbi:unnamed protein product [Heterobilharzia americana]|nr:unnamed protein product [Heterobilharzia americana]